MIEPSAHRTTTSSNGGARGAMSSSSSSPARNTRSTPTTQIFVRPWLLQGDSPERPQADSGPLFSPTGEGESTRAAASSSRQADPARVGMSPDDARVRILGGRNLVSSDYTYEDEEPETALLLLNNSMVPITDACALRTPPGTPPTLRSTARLAEPATPPPNYRRMSIGGDEDATRLTPTDDRHRLIANSTNGSPRVNSNARSALLQLSSSSAVQTQGGEATPPPTYPSPPRYLNHTPPPFRGSGAGETSTEMVNMGELEWSAAQLSEIDRQYDEIFERHEGGIDDGTELAPPYKDDVGVLSGLRRTRHFSCLILTTCLFTLIALYITGVSEWLTDEQRNFEVCLFAMYAIYAIECFGCVTSALLWNVRTAPEANEYFYQMMDSAPYVKWTIRCYHLRRPVDPGAARPNDKVITFNRTQQHGLLGCADDTPLRFFTSHRMCLYQFAKSRRWRDAAAEQRYEDAKQAYIDENNKDDFYEIEEDWGLEGFEDEFLAARPGQPLPSWAHWKVFMVFTLLGLSLFYRIYFASRIGKQKITFKKIMW